MRVKLGDSNANLSVMYSRLMLGAEYIISTPPKSTFWASNDSEWLKSKY